MKLIDKDALVKEIEKRIDTTGDSSAYLCGKLQAYREILKFINTLEVKEVDLDDKDKWKNTGGFGSTWDPDSPDYCPD